MFIIIASNSLELKKDGENSYEMKLVSDGETINAKLRKPLDVDNHGLGKNFHLIIADVNAEGEPTFNRWTPTKKQIMKAAETLYVDPDVRAIFSIQPDAHQGYKVVS